MKIFGATFGIRGEALPPLPPVATHLPPFRVDVAVCDGDYEERPQFTNYCSSRTQTLFANMFN